MTWVAWPHRCGKGVPVVGRRNPAHPHRISEVQKGMNDFSAVLRMDPHPDPQDPNVFGPPGFVIERYGSEDPDPHSDSEHNVTDPQNCF
jgi:hypothetical protein